MATENEGHGIEGVTTRSGDKGSHQIDFALLDEATRQQVIDCITKHGKISVVIDGGDLSGKSISDGGFSRLID